MGLLLRLFVLISLVRAFLHEERPVLFASIYAGFCFALGLIGFLIEGIDVTIPGLLLGVAIRGGLAFVYFWALKATSGLFWWVVLIPGLLIVV